MSCLQKKKNKHFYIVQSVKINGVWRNKYRRATANEIEAHLKNRAQKERVDLTTVSCARPACDQMRIVTRKQKEYLKTTLVVKQKRFSDFYCSTACREKHLEEMKLLTK